MIALRHVSVRQREVRNVAAARTLLRVPSRQDLTNAAGQWFRFASECEERGSSGTRGQTEWNSNFQTSLRISGRQLEDTIFQLADGRGNKRAGFKLSLLLTKRRCSGERQHRRMSARRGTVELPNGEISSQNQRKRADPVFSGPLERAKERVSARISIGSPENL